MRTSKETTNEIWKDIANYEGIYQVSSFGNVRRTNGNPPKLKKNLIKPTGYVRISLHKKGAGQFFSVHRLVAFSFLPNPNNKPYINHKNGIKHDNRVENLEWVTQSENIKHRFDVLKKPNKKGGENKLSTAIIQYDLSGKEIGRFNSMSEAKSALGVTTFDISSSCKVSGQGFYFCKNNKPQ